MKHFYYARLGFNQAIAYRVSMLLSLLIGPFNLLVQYFIWAALFSSGQAIAGYTLTSVMQYFIAAVLTRYVLYNAVLNEFDKLVVHGELAKELLRPVSIMSQLLMRALGGRALALLVEILPILLVLALLFGITSIIPSQPLTLFAGLIIAFLINFYQQYLFGLSAFWTKRTHGAKMVSFSLFLIATGYAFPLDILPQTLQVISSYLPFQHIIYAPAKYFTQGYALGAVNNSTHNLLLGAMWVGVLHLISKALENKALNKYQGVGQ